jgi:hypothetical protein
VVREVLHLLAQTAVVVAVALGATGLFRRNLYQSARHTPLPLEVAALEVCLLVQQVQTLFFPLTHQMAVVVAVLLLLTEPMVVQVAAVERKVLFQQQAEELETHQAQTHLRVIMEVDQLPQRMVAVAVVVVLEEPVAQLAQEPVGPLAQEPQTQ